MEITHKTEMYRSVASGPNIQQLPKKLTDEEAIERIIVITDRLGIDRTEVMALVNVLMQEPRRNKAELLELELHEVADLEAPMVLPVPKTPRRLMRFGRPK